jgi:predicted neuraminidase
MRWILVVLAWIVCAVTLLPERHYFSDLSYSPDIAPQPHNDGGPFFKVKFLNIGQKLPMVHVASPVELKGGELASVWYGGSGECAPDVQIYFATFDSEPRVIMNRARVQQDLGRPVQSLGNAVVLANRDGSLRLVFVSIALGKWSGSQLNTCVSRDNGLSWSRVERLTLSPFFNFSELVRNRPIALNGGCWCVPVYQEFLGKFPELLWLDEVDGTLIARKTRVAGGCSVFQPSLIPLDKRTAVVLLRDYTDAHRIYMSRSENGGVTWSRPVPTNLPNPDAGISGLKLSDGRLLVAYNDSTTDRTNLALAVSQDEGLTWKRIALFNSLNASNKTFSYPYLMHDSAGYLHLAYTADGKRIELDSFGEEWLAFEEHGAGGKP